MKKRPSMNRIHARQLEQKILPSIKLLSKYMFSTAPDAPKKDFYGYRVNAGTFTDNSGVVWQTQIHAYCTKSKFIKVNEIQPIIRKWALMFKLRLFVKVLIDKLFNE